jgi:hypothetical protein
MFLHNPVLDVCLVFACLYSFRSFILVDETANEDVELLVKHSKLWIRFVLWICELGFVTYMTLTDFSIIDGRYYIECLHILVAMAYLEGVYGNFVGFKYGPKDEANRRKNLSQLRAIIALPIIALFIYFL